MVLAPSSLTPSKPLELDASFNEAETWHSSVSSKFLCLFTTNSDVSKLQLAHSIKSHKF